MNVVKEPMDVDNSCYKLSYLPGYHKEIFWTEELSFVGKDVGISLVDTEKTILVGISEKKHRH